MMNVKRIQSLEMLLPYQTIWSDMLERNKNTNPFIEFEWVYEWWKHFGDHSVEVSVVYEEGTVIGFVPCAVKRKKYSSLYQFIGNDKANYMDAIADQENLGRIISFVVSEILLLEKNVVFKLHGLLGINQTYNALERFTKEKRLPVSTFQTITPYIDLSNLDLNVYMQKRGKLHGLNRREKKLKKLDLVSIDTCSKESMNEVFSLHEKRWKTRYDTSRFTENKEQQFFRSLSEIQKVNFKTEIDALYIGSKMVAFHYGFSCRGRYVVYTLSHDHDFDLFSPGRILEKELIHRKAHHAMNMYDMSIGYEAYKKDWATDNDYTKMILFSSKQPLARCVRTSLHLKEKLKEKLKSNYRLVMFKRNSLGKARFLIRQLLMRNTDVTLRKLLLLGLRRIDKRLVNRRKYSYYCINVGECRGAKGQVQFDKLTLGDALSSPKIDPTQMKEICRLFYYGYDGYYPSGDLNVDNIFWIHDRLIRLDDISYQEELNHNNIHLRSKNMDYLEKFIHFMLMKRKINYVILTVKNISKEQQSVIKDFPVTFRKRI